MASAPPPETSTPPATPRALRPFAENAFRVLELGVDATAADAAKASVRLASKIASGDDDPTQMIACGPPTRSAEQVKLAAHELAEPARAAVHALFMPWLTELPGDPQALANALRTLHDELQARITPLDVVGPLAPRLLPPVLLASDAERSVAVGGYLFPGDIDLDEAIGPPRRPQRGVAAADEAGFLAALERAPSALSNALLAAARLGIGRKLHAAYLRSLLAAADAGEAAAWRRLPTAATLFHEVKSEPSASLVLAWRDFVEGRFDEASKGLQQAEVDPRLTPAEQNRARVLRIRLHATDAPDQALHEVEGLEGPEGAALRGALLLQEGDVERAGTELERAWALPELRPRLAPLLALVQVERLQLDAAQESLAFAGQGNNAALARARLAHARGRASQAVESYRDSVGEEDEAVPLGAWWGLAILSDDAEERGAARTWLEEATSGTELAAPLARGALSDGELDEAEAWLGRLGDDGEAQEVRALILDRLGRRSEAWALRGVHEDEVRDRARAALEAGHPESALDELAGLSMADPLRRRAARASVARALARAPGVDPDQVVRRTLGRLSAEELALLDLPASLYRAVREIGEGQVAAAVTSLRRHLDGTEDPLAARLFEVLHAPPAESWSCAARFVLALTQQPDLGSVIALGRELDPTAWDAALVLAAVDELPVGVAVPLTASAPVRCAAAWMVAQAAADRQDWDAGEEALRELEAALPSPSTALHDALGAVQRARFSTARRTDLAAALEALESDPATSRQAAHDRAVYRHALLALAAVPDVEELVDLLHAWEAAREVDALSHPAHPAERAVLEGEVVAALVELLTAIPAAKAADARYAIDASGSALGRIALERGGWLGHETPNP